jgi:hypothetical protein
MRSAESHQRNEYNLQLERLRMADRQTTLSIVVGGATGNVVGGASSPATGNVCRVWDMTPGDLRNHLRTQNFRETVLAKCRNLHLDGDTLMHLTETEVNEYFEDSDKLQRGKLCRLIAKVKKDHSDLEA